MLFRLRAGLISLQASGNIFSLETMTDSGVLSVSVTSFHFNCLELASLHCLFGPVVARNWVQFSAGSDVFTGALYIYRALNC